MAKTSAADQARPVVAIFVKQHFWMLAVLVPLILVPSLLAARGQLAAQIDDVRRKIDGHISALQNVRKIPQHPNSSWANDIDTSTMRVKRETFAEWRKLWDSQQPLRVWPESLGPDFVKAVDALKPEAKLSPRLLERYQNNVRSLVRELPARMGVEDGMGDATEAGQAAPIAQQPRVRPDGLRPGEGPAGKAAEASPFFAVWDEGNQRRIASTFDWDKKPSTAKVLLAQEELWVYGILCDVVARMNKSATGPHNAAIAGVDELYVGYLAAEDNPGGVAGGRVTRVASTQASDAMAGPPPDLMAPGAEQQGIAGRPPNPRFAGGPPGGGAVPMQPGPPSAETGETVDPDVALRNWVYVDFTGKPLDATQLEAAVDCQMVHLMPFVLRVVIDERQIDALLVALSTAPIPIDVRQVRIATSSAQQVPTQARSDAALPSGAGRFYDVPLELRGTVGLATPPNEKTVGLEPGQGDAVAPADAENKASPPAKAALFGRPIRRRIAT
jgi:hypothetical protein